ncbi:MAG: serine protease [Pseudomonadota bacterium]
MFTSALRIPKFLLLVFLCTGATPSLAQPTLPWNEHVVRVTVTSPNHPTQGQSSTGFLWRSSDQVVTSLHGVLAAREEGWQIDVICRGNPVRATPDRVLKKADLVMLKTDQPVVGCTPFEGSVDADPESGLAMQSAGWPANALIDLELKKRGVYSGKETLAGLVYDGKVLEALRVLQFPATNLPVYLVSAEGLRAGYSGAPAVDRQGQLRGIVDGGLAKGTADYNWLVPARFLKELEASTERALPVVNNGELLSALFSTGIVADDLELSYSRQGSDGDRQFNFVRTKTRRLDTIVDTAEAGRAAGMQMLLLRYLNILGVGLTSSIAFDIYEDTNSNLSLAVPQGQALSISWNEELGYQQIISQAEYGYIEYYETTSAIDDEGTVYRPGDDGFLPAFAQEQMRYCAEAAHECRFDQRTGAMDVFENESRTYTFGIWREEEPDEEDPTRYRTYRYYSIALKQDFAFVSYADIETVSGDDSLFECQGNCASAEASTDFAQLAAVQLTTFDAGFASRTNECYGCSLADKTSATQYNFGWYLRASLGELFSSDESGDWNAIRKMLENMQIDEASASGIELDFFYDQSRNLRLAIPASHELYDGWSETFSSLYMLRSEGRFDSHIEFYEETIAVADDDRSFTPADPGFATAFAQQVMSYCPEGYNCRLQGPDAVPYGGAVLHRIAITGDSLDGQYRYYDVYRLLVSGDKAFVTNVDLPIDSGTSHVYNCGAQQRCGPMALDQLAQLIAIELTWLGQPAETAF